MTAPGVAAAASFVERYVAAELALVRALHRTRDDAEADALVAAFEETYLGPGCFADVGRPGAMGDEEWAEYAALGAQRRARRVVCVGAVGDVVAATLGSPHFDSDEAIELAVVEQVAGSWRVVATYLTEFDGTFSHASGRDCGARLPDPCRG